MLKKILFGFVMALVFSPCQAAQLTQLKPQTFTSHQGQNINLDHTTRVVLYVPDHTSGQKLKPIFAKYDHLPPGLVIIVNISQAPSLVRNFIIKPLLSRIDLPLVILEDPDKIPNWPYQEDHITQINLNNLKVRQILFIQDPAKIERLFNQ